MNLFDTAIRNKSYLLAVKNAKERLEKIDNKEWIADHRIQEAKEKIEKADKQHQQNVDDKKDLDRAWKDLEDNAMLFNTMKDTASLAVQKQVIERTCSVITKMTTNSIFTKKLKPYVVSAELLNNYATDNQVRELLMEEFRGDPNQKFVLQFYDNAMSYHYSPVLVAWGLYELLHHTT